MAGIGLQGAYGVAGAQDALQQLLAQRMQQEAIRRQMEQQTAQGARADRGLDLESRGLDLEQERMSAPPPPDKPISMAPGGSLVDPSTGRIITQIPERPEKPQGPMTLSPGGRLVDPATGRIIASAPTQGPAPDFEWVTGPNGPRQIPKGTAQFGDRPYEKGEGRAADAISPYAAERNTRNLESVDALLGKVSRWTTGVGSLLANLPETDARNFSAELDTLKANISFGELTAMREASKTGGALGQVSDRELKLLSSALGALDTGQSPQNIREQLVKIRDSIKRWQAAKGGNAQPMASHGTGNGATAAADLIKKYGGQ